MKSLPFTTTVYHYIDFINAINQKVEYVTHWNLAL